MTIKYSPSTNGFYDVDISTAIPVDAFIIDDVLYNNLLVDNRAGKEIVYDSGTNLPKSIEWKDSVTLDEVKKAKIAELKQEALSRMQLILPGIKDFDTLELMQELWSSILPAAKSVTTDLASVINIYQAGKSAAIDINALATNTLVYNYDVVNSPSWPS